MKSFAISNPKKNKIKFDLNYLQLANFKAFIKIRKLMDEIVKLFRVYQTT
jgi:hypothetical protein